MLLDELAPYFGEDGSNVRVSGPPIAFNAKCALTLGMAIHELATNAAKHGALSTKSGSVEVAWQVDPGEQAASDMLDRERRSNREPPATSGFGRLLLERALASDLGAMCSWISLKKALKCDIAIPLD